MKLFLKQMLNKKLFFIGIILLCYILLNIVGVIYHEPWRDEAQAWLIARDLDLPGLFYQMGYEGTPALWHIILFPFAKAGFPYLTEFILHLLIAITAVGIFLVFAPLPRYFKVLFAFSAFMSYYYSIIARSYTLSILLLFILLAVYPKRFEKPLLYSFMLMLLFNTNVHSFIPALVLSVIFVFEIIQYRQWKKSTLLAVSIILFGIALVIWQLQSPPDNINYGLITGWNPKAPFIALITAFSVPLQVNRFIPMLFLFLLLISFTRNIKVFIFLFTSLSWLFYLFLFKHRGGPYHHGLILILLLAGIWLAKYYSKEKPSENRGSFQRLTYIHQQYFAIFFLTGSLLLSALNTIDIYRFEIKENKSGSKAVAEFILKNNYQNMIIVAYRGPQTSSVLPYLSGVRFWYADSERWGTFIIWDQKYSNGASLTNQEIMERVRRRFYNQNHLLLCSTPLADAGKFGAVLLYETGFYTYYDEHYYLYQLNNAGTTVP